MTTIEIYRNKKREWCWRAKRKGRIVADSGESYKRIASALSALYGLFASIQANKVIVKQEGKVIEF